MKEFKTTETNITYDNVFVKLTEDLMKQVVESRNERDMAWEAYNEQQYALWRWRAIAIVSLLGFAFNVVFPWTCK